MERLDKLGLVSLEVRRLRGDLIEVYKVTCQRWDRQSKLLPQGGKKKTNARGNSFKERRAKFEGDTDIFFVTQRAVRIWNRLVGVMIEAGTIVAFKRLLEMDMHGMEGNRLCAGGWSCS